MGGYYLSDVSTTSCPMAGTCSQMSESTRCDCLSSGDITVCPFCNATTSEKTYQYNDISTDLTMTFSGTVMGCIMSVNYSCWYDIMTLQHPTSPLHSRFLM